MTTYLLDASVLIALTVRDHEHYDRASSWASGVERFAVCPVVEGALVRYLLRVGETPTTALAVLRGVHAVPGCEFWPDGMSYTQASLHHVRGHRQVTDAYLVSLAAEHDDALLATLDGGLARERPDGTLLLPEP